MWSRKPRSRISTRILIAVTLMTGLIVLFNTLLVQAEGTAEATENPAATQSAPVKTPFANALTQMAAPPSTEGPTLAVTATPSPASAVSANTGSLSSADALATITSQAAQIKALQDQLAANQGDKGATLYAVVIIVIGILLAFGVFFGLRRG